MITLGALTLGAGLAYAEVRRFALIAANNEGDPDTNALVFAETDAKKVQRTLTELGGYGPGDVWMSLGRDRPTLLTVFGELRRAISDARAQDAEAEIVFLFYYSGHADEQGLQLGRTQLTYEELERMLDNSGADVRLALVDGCNSGALTRRKGGTMAPSFVFDVTERLNTQGTVIITSSTGDEASQESDEIGGSYFTHYLVSGMRGAADADGDAKVTLSEVYDHVYRETVIKTANTRIGAQHPTFDWDLAGEGDVVLTDLDPATSALLFPSSLTGAYAVFDLDRREFVGEVEAGAQTRRLAVREGRYLVQVRFPTHLKVAEVRVNSGQQLDMSAASFRTMSYNDDVAKGHIQREVRRASRPESAVRLLVGTTSAVQAQVVNEVLPTMGVGGVSYRVDWRGGQWLAVDAFGGAGMGTLTMPELNLSVPARSSVASVGASVGYATRSGWAGAQAGAGLRVAGLYLGRSVDDGGAPLNQYALALSPGLVVWGGLQPGRLVLDLEIHRQVVPYTLEEGGSATFPMRDVLLSAGVRW